MHLFNFHYVNIGKDTSGKAPEIEGNQNNKSLDMFTLTSVIKKYENHGGIINIKSKGEK